MNKDIIEWLTDHCARLKYGRCTTLACLNRGGYEKLKPVADYDIATCEPFEIAVALDLKKGEGGS